jgi:outer membrane protein assembly factor BamB
MRPSTKRRLGRALLTVCVLLFVAFFALVAYEKFYATRARQADDAGLLAELAGATILEEEPPGTADWPQWRGPNRDGVAHDPDLLTAWPGTGLPQVWHADAGLGYSSVAVAAGRAYTLVSKDGGEAVVCWWAADGKELWRFPYDQAGSTQYPGPRATPTVDGDRLYTLGAGGLLHCLGAADGKEVWKHDFRTEFQAPGGQWGHACSPLVEGGLVYTSPGGRGASLAAFDKATGAVVWKGLDDLPGYSSPVAFTAGGVRQVVFFTGNAVVGVTPDSGKLLWRYPWQTSFNVNAATPLTFHAKAGDRVLDYVFVSSGYGRGCGLLKIEADGPGGFRARRVFENNQLCSHFASPVRYRDHVYGFNESALTCMDLRTGAVRWHESGFQKGSLLRVDGYLLVLGERGNMALLEASPREGRPLATAQPFRGHCWTMPALAGGRLFVRNEQQVLCLDLGKKN